MCTILQFLLFNFLQFLQQQALTERVFDSVMYGI